ncbi:MAG: hypothetical protein AB2660_16600 [Candidatus Thiodiazotropha sp.]
MNIDEVRTKYPEYDDLSDKQLADAIHKKYYSDLDVEDFYQKIGFSEPKGFGAQLQDEIESIPRQLGLTARAGIEGPMEVAGVFTNPIAYGLNKTLGTNIPYAGKTGEEIANMLGLPTPESTQEKVVNQATKFMTGVGGQAALANKTAQGASGVTKGLLQSLSANPGTQITGVGAAGAGSEYVKETGGGKSAQLIAGLLGGLGGSASVGLANGIKNQLGNYLRAFKASKQGFQRGLDSLEAIIERNGIKLGDLPPDIRNTLSKELNLALETGKEVDDSVIRRLADYSLTRTTPRAGRVSLDPAAITQEKNLEKIGVNSLDKRLQELGQISRRNDKQLTSILNDMGANQADDALTAGAKLSTTLKAIDAPRKETVTAAYNAVKDSQGRYAKLDTKWFSERANGALDKEMLGSSLPEKTRTLLNDISGGKVPLNVNTMIQIYKRLSSQISEAFRKGEREAGTAIRVVRDALNDTPILSGQGEAAKALYKEAQSLAAKRFQAIRNNPMMQAALDEEAPDKFVQTYIIGSGKKASAKSVKALSDELLDNDPQTYQVARQQIMAFLKGKALSGAADDTGNFSPSAYNRAIDSIGDSKLRAFFSDDEVSMMKAVGRVASYEKFQPTGSAVNNSNTASALGGLMERVATSPLAGNLPFGDAAIRVPLGNILNSRNAGQAMNPLMNISKPAQPGGLLQYVPPSLLLPALTLD